KFGEILIAALASIVPLLVIRPSVRVNVPLTVTTSWSPPLMFKALLLLLAISMLLNEIAPTTSSVDPVESNTTVPIVPAPSLNTPVPEIVKLEENVTGPTGALNVPPETANVLLKSTSAFDGV